MPRLRKGPKEVGGISAGGETHQDVSLAAKGDHLAREDELEAHVVGEGGDHCLVRHKRTRVQRPPMGRIGEQRGQRVGVRGASAVAHGEQPTAGVEPVGDFGRRGVEPITTLAERRDPQRRALVRLGPSRRQQVGQEGPGILPPGLEERVEEVGGGVTHWRPPSRRRCPHARRRDPRARHRPGA